MGWRSVAGEYAHKPVRHDGHPNQKVKERYDHARTALQGGRWVCKWGDSSRLCSFHPAVFVLVHNAPAAA
jgi:hypothetical protein